MRNQAHFSFTAAATYYTCTLQRTHEHTESLFFQRVQTPSSFLYGSPGVELFVVRMICKLKVKKATGPDGVPARLLKSAGKPIAPSLTSVFGHSAETCKPPDQWKIARVSAAFKKGREEDRT